MTPELTAVGRRLEQRGFAVRLCADLDAADALLPELTGAPAAPLAVGFGNSVTLRELDWPEKLRAMGHGVHARSPENMDNEDARQALRSDLYFTSANALSADGLLVNIDGTGNRVAASCFGPKKVVFVLGRNKLCFSLEAAVERAKQAAVRMAKKHARKTPCTVTGKCEDCLAPECICAVMAIHRRPLRGSECSIVLIDRDLGI